MTETTVPVFADSGDRTCTESPGHRVGPANEAERETTILWGGVSTRCGCLPLLCTPADRL